MRILHTYSLFLALIFILSAPSVQASDPGAGHGISHEGASGHSATRRPTELEHLRTNTAYTVHRGGLEVDVVAAYFGFDHEEEIEIVAEFEYGLTDDLTVEVAVPFVRMSPRPVHTDDGGGHGVDPPEEESHGDADAGLGNIEVEAKYALFHSGALTGAVLAAVGLPTATVGHDIWEFAVSVPLSLDVEAASLGIHFEPGAMAMESDGFERGFANLAFDYYACPAGVIVHLAFNSEFGDGTETVSAVPGLAVGLEDHLGIPVEIAVGFPIGLNDESENWGALFDVQIGL